MSSEFKMLLCWWRHRDVVLWQHKSALSEGCCYELLALCWCCHWNSGEKVKCYLCDLKQPKVNRAPQKATFLILDGSALWTCPSALWCKWQHGVWGGGGCAVAGTVRPWQPKFKLFHAFGEHQPPVLLLGLAFTKGDNWWQWRAAFFFFFKGKSPGVISCEP